MIYTKEQEKLPKNTLGFYLLLANNIIQAVGKNINKIRVIVTLSTIVVVTVLAIIFGLIARGYSFDLKTLQFAPSGLLVIKSVPDAAEIFIDGEFETATNATLRLKPATYDIEITKEGYFSWSKRVVIEKEVVVEQIAYLFRSTPSLSATTFSGVVNPIATADNTQIAYAVPLEKNNGVEKAGLWVIETVNLPLGFSKDPRRITDGNLVNASWLWSPDGREILLTTSAGIFLLDTSEFTPQAERINVATRKNLILAEWEEESKKKLSSKIRSLPDPLVELFSSGVSRISFSPDEKKVLYTASSSAFLKDELIKPVPGSSTQRQERNVVSGNTYVYDIKEDRNFLIEANISGKQLAWFPSSAHLVFGESNEVSIIDYDGTNKKAIYTGAYEAPFVFPTLNEDRVLILTNLGSNDSLSNLYSLNLK